MIKEHACFTEECPEAGRVVEHYYRSTDPDPVCESCSQPMKQLISRFGVVFTGPLTTKYNDNKADNAWQEGHWAYRVRSAENPNKPEPIFIDSFQKQKEYCRDEGLINPKDIGTWDIPADGKRRSNAGVGMPGAWT